MDFEIFLWSADVDPILIEKEGHHRLFVLEKRRKQTAFERIGFPFRHVLEDARFQYIDPGVDGVAGDFVGTGLFNESLNPAVGTRFDKSIGRGVFYRGEDYRSNCFFFTMMR